MMSYYFIDKFFFKKNLSFSSNLYLIISKNPKNLLVKLFILLKSAAIFFLKKLLKNFNSFFLLF